MTLHSLRYRSKVTVGEEELAFMFQHYNPNFKVWAQKLEELSIRYPNAYGWFERDLNRVVPIGRDIWEKKLGILVRLWRQYGFSGEIVPRKPAWVLPKHPTPAMVHPADL